MNDYFAELTPSGDPAAAVQRFYRAVGQLNTLEHVTQVAALAKEMAARHGQDPESTHLAALAHDLAVPVPVIERPVVAEQMGIEVSEADHALPALLHGPIAAAALADKLGVRDEDVLNAIRYHTTLRAGASVLEKIVFLADKIAYDPTSPHRGEYLFAVEAANSLNEAALAYLTFIIDNTWRYGWHLHPNTLAAYRDLTRKSP